MNKTKPRILFVDDHEDTRFLLLQWLGSKGFEVATAENFGQALNLAKTQTFDLFILDYKFSEGTGKELCEKIREFDPATPIVFFSGSHPKLQQEALSCGAQGFVMKPEFDTLLCTIERVLYAQAA